MNTSFTVQTSEKPVFRHKHLLSAGQLTRAEIEALFATCKQYLEQMRVGQRRFPVLEGCTVVLAFIENSTRTRISFETAAKRLSADVIVFESNVSSLSKGETLSDSAKVIEQMRTDFFIMRHPYSGACEYLAERIDSSVINAGDGQHQHPTQALLDAYTLKERLGRMDGVKVCIVGDIRHSRVARSNIQLLKTLGAQVALCAPGTLLPYNTDVFQTPVFTHIDEAVEWADVVNVLRLQKERMEQALLPNLSEYHKYFAVKEKHLLAKPDLIVMHPGPVNRGVELDSAVADSPNSIILQQVESGLPIRMAIMAHIQMWRKHISATSSSVI